MKTRAFDPETKQWRTDYAVMPDGTVWRIGRLNLESNVGNYSTNFLFEQVNWRLSRFTGLYDKDKVEIYEGTIIIDSRTNKYYVARFDMIYGLRFYDLNGYYTMPIEPVKHPQTSIKVIGNIFQNPELLEV